MSVLLERKQETKLVKSALKAAGFEGVRVTHGKGTSWGWLDIYFDLPVVKHHCDVNGLVKHLTRTERSDSGFPNCVFGCPSCQLWKDKNAEALEIAQRVTGRKGDYDGNILIQIDEAEGGAV